MSAPLIFNGRRAKMLTQDGILRSDGSIIDNNGVPNLIKNGHAEINVTGWTVSKNTVAASRPDSGFVTSSTNITWTRNTTNPIDGQADFLYTKDAANRQGEQVYYGFTVAKKYRAKVLQIEVDYLVNSGTFSAGSSSTDSDVILYIYDVTNSTFIEPSSFKFLSNSSTIADKFIANFQTSATGSSYRILFHQATTSASAFAVQFKDVRVSPCNYVYGTPISDWVSYTPTLSGGFSNGNSNASVTGKWRRVGDSIELDGKITVGSSNTFSSSHLQISLPSGLSWDTSKIAFEDNVSPIGFAQVYDSSFGGGFKAFPVKYGTTTFSINTPFNNSFSGTTFERLDFNGVATGTTHPFAWANGDIINFKIEAMPITGWSSSTQVSDGYDARVIGLKVNSTGTTGTLNTSDNVVKHAATTINDTTASYSASTGLWTCPRSDWYIVSGSYGISHTTASGFISASIGVNGTIVAEDYKYVNGAADSQQSVQSQAIYITAGQTVGLYSKTSLTTPAFTATSKNNWFSIIAAKSPQTMSATEVVAASYQMGTAQTLTSAATIKFDTKLVDTHNAYNTTTGVFTAPVSGIYEISAQLFSITATANWQIAARKNSATVSRSQPLPIYNGGTSLVNNQSLNILSPILVALNAGETIDIYNLTGIGTGTLYASTQDNWMMIKRIK